MLAGRTPPASKEELEKVQAIVAEGVAREGLQDVILPSEEAAAKRLAHMASDEAVDRMIAEAQEAGISLLDGPDGLISQLTAGLVLTAVLLTSRLVPRSLSILGIAGYALLLAGVVCNLLGIADIGWHVSPAGIVFLAPGGLFELLFPLLLIARGFSAGSRARPVPVHTTSARHRDVTAA